MDTVITRRAVVLGAASLSTLGIHASRAIAQPTPAASRNQIREIEAKNGGRLGVIAVGTGTGATVEYRADERFPLTSTFKFLAAAAVLRRVDTGEEKLDRIIPYTEADIEPTYSPVTKDRAGLGMASSISAQPRS